MSASASTKQKERLIELRARLENHIKHLQHDLDRAQQHLAEEASSGDRLAEAAALVQSRETGVSLEEQLSTLLERVEAAIRAIDEGRYGICAACGRPIPEERLEALPYAERCVDCQRKEEKR